MTAAEIYFEHDSASFGNKMTRIPVVLGPVGAAAGVAGFFSRRMAKTALPRSVSPAACAARRQNAGVDKLEPFEVRDVRPPGGLQQRKKAGVRRVRDGRRSKRCATP